MGADVIARALQAPMRQIAVNSGHDGGVVVSEALEQSRNIGFDGNTGEFVDMLKSGIVDPTKVCRTALQNAASLAGLLLTTDTLISEIKDEDEKTVEGAVQ